MNTTNFPATREKALARLAEFAPRAQKYAKERNHVIIGHDNVTRLSPAVRHRLITEQEVAQAALDHHKFYAVEKFVQEVYWRRYWKSWLDLRPQVWTQYQEELEGLSDYDEAFAADVMAGEGPVDIMNLFARELVETGYLHNHARMWFAGYWIHIARLPWALGSQFFEKHLLDWDPASNTLSWKWVAGLQTKGKSYLPRKSNLQKFLDPEVLQHHPRGLDQLAHPEAIEVPDFEKEPITAPDPLQSAMDPGLNTAFWIHEEDLSASSHHLLAEIPIVITQDTARWERSGYGEPKISWLKTAHQDTAERYQNATLLKGDAPAELAKWCEEHQIQQLVTMAPSVGPVRDQLSRIEATGIQLTLHQRDFDAQLHPLGKAGFFSFWKKTKPLVQNL